MVGEAGEDRRDDFFEIAGYLLKYVLAVPIEKWRHLVRTGPRAIEAAAKPIRPPFLACG